jgi:hypothetical protein
MARRKKIAEEEAPLTEAQIKKLASVKKKFVDSLRKSKEEPHVARVAVGIDSGQTEVVEDYRIKVDSDGDAWLFLGQHAQLTRQVT